jgi:hypothetical protein
MSNPFNYSMRENPWTLDEMNYNLAKKKRNSDAFYKEMLRNNLSLENRLKLQGNRASKNLLNYAEKQEANKKKTEERLRKGISEAEDLLRETEKSRANFAAKEMEWDRKEKEYLESLPNEEALKLIEDRIQIAKEATDTVKKINLNRLNQEQKATGEIMNRDAGIVLSAFNPENTSLNAAIQARLNQLKQVRSGVRGTYKNKQKELKASHAYLNKSLQKQTERYKKIANTIRKRTGGRRTRRRRV